MSHRKKISSGSDTVDVQYQNAYAQMISLIGARKSYIHLGRGSAKTTDVQCERLIDLVYEMPGAPAVWVADTFTNLSSNVLPAVLEGLDRKGFKEGVHYVIEKAPPTFSEKEKAQLPDWLRPHFWQPFNHLATFKRTIIFFTGFNIRFGSLDRPSSLAGGSFVFVFGDEGKYFHPDKIANLLKANRGYYLQYGQSIFYRGVMFTSDLADTSHIGEYDWMEKEAGNMDVPTTLQVLQVGMVLNQAQHEYVAAEQQYMKTKSPEDLKDCKNKLKTVNRWLARWKIARKQPGAQTLYVRASSYVNVDILTADWFSDAIASGLSDLHSAILSIRQSLESGDRFYTRLSARNFYFDGVDENVYDSLGMFDEPDCRILRYLKLDSPLYSGVDFGNMCSMSVSQEGREGGRYIARILKFIYTLAPEYIEDLGTKFRKFFEPMKRKVLYLYYDRAGNAYRSVKQDQVSKLKQAIEVDSTTGQRTGWVVHLMSLNQGDIRQSQEYGFMISLLGEEDPRLPLVLIDAYQCKPLKCSLEKARTKVKNGIVYKNKSSEKLPVPDLPLKSTNPSDSFKYLLMTKDRVRLWKSLSKAAVMPNDIH